VSLLRKMEEKGVLVRPSSRVLEVAQSRRAEKEFARFIGAEPVPHRCIGGVEALQDADDYSELFPGILKTDRLGYDGRGQAAISDHSALVEAMERFAAPCVLEKRMPLDFEASILVARTSPHHIRVSSIVKNVHQGGILVETRWDRSMDRCQIAELGFAKIAADAAEALDLHGILAIEFFVSGGKLFFNEMAPRPHNSFHGSIEAARTSQFEQHIRAICGLPLGDVVFRTPFRMVNLLGDDWRQWEEYIDGDKVHLYGKSEPRPGRKMGHVTLLDVP
jgi:5-(carboxyamino)imidazole ribonucleotide synthase